jgi:hypothetical protein
MALINSPPTTAVDQLAQEGGTYSLAGVVEGWRNFFQAVYSICTALTTSGTTAKRPTSGLWIGRTYFDTTLGIPIWLKSTSPTVWCNSAGAAV